MTDETQFSIEPIPTFDDGKWTRPVPDYARPHVPGGTPPITMVQPPPALSLAFDAEVKRNADAETIATLRAILTLWVADFAAYDEDGLAHALAISNRTPEERALIRRTRAVLGGATA